MSRKVLLILLFVISCSIAIFAESNSHKLLVNGRTWNYMSLYYPMYSGEKPDTVYESMTIEGPYEFDGKECYTFSNVSLEEGEERNYFYEEGGKVYFYGYNHNKHGYCWKEEFNFNLNPGENGVISVDTILVNGEYYRRLNFSRDVWVEGIGSLECALFSNWGTVPGAFMASKVISVYDGDKCIFTTKNFLQEAVSTTGLQDPDSTNNIENESLYGEWRLVGWYDEGTWFKVDTNYVSHQHLSIEFKENGYVEAWSMVNEITVGQLTLNGNDMVWDTTHRGTTMVGCDIMENNFFEDHIFDIKSCQISGKELKLYYTDEDYLMFTKDYDDSEEYAYAWKNGLPDPYFGEVTMMNDGEVTVKVLDYPRYAHYYTLSRPPSDSYHICHFAASDLSGLSLEVGDKVAFLIDQFRRQKGNEREYQCVVRPYESSSRVDDVVGFVYNDKLFQGWCIMVPNDNYNSTATYYIPMKPLPESYLTDGQPVVFSGTLYPTQCYVSNYAHRSDAQYFVDNDKLEKLSSEEVHARWSVTPVEEGDVYAVLSDYFQNKYPSVPSSYQFFRKTDNNKTEMYNRSDNIHLGEKAEFPEIDLSNYTLVVGQQVMEDGYYTVVRQDMVPAVDGWQLNLYVKKEEGDHSSPQYLFYWGLYPQKEYYHISVNIVEETHTTAYRPFVEDGKVWKVGDYFCNPVQRVEYYYFDGDTIIGGKACKQMMCQRYVNAENPDYAFISQLPSLSYVGAWYEEDKKVYEYDSTTNQFKLMYDFSLNANDTLDDTHYVIGPRQTGGIKGFKGVYRNIIAWMIEKQYICDTWLEGVGSLSGPLGFTIYSDVSPGLMSCTVGDEVIFLNDEYEDGVTPAEARKRRFDFTHTIKIQPKARNKRVAEVEQSIYGEYNDLQLGINLDPLDDAYLVRITDESGKAVYQKNVNAGNIVGLNIDISSYAEGRYTVIVENSLESFTGEFEAQPTGIKEVRSQKSEVRGQIYNLQGQRISTLQKGLNIVNGQKVFIK